MFNIDPLSLFKTVDEHYYLRRHKIGTSYSTQLSFAFLVASDSFRQLLLTRVTAVSTLECSNECMSHPLSQGAREKFILFHPTTPNSTLNHLHIIIFGRKWTNVAPILNAIFFIKFSWKIVIRLPSNIIFSTSIFFERKYEFGRVGCSGLSVFKISKLLLYYLSLPLIGSVWNSDFSIVIAYTTFGTGYFKFV